MHTCSVIMSAGSGGQGSVDESLAPCNLKPSSRLVDALKSKRAPPIAIAVGGAPHILKPHEARAAPAAVQVPVKPETTAAYTGNGIRDNNYLNLTTWWCTLCT